MHRMKRLNIKCFFAKHKWFTRGIRIAAVAAVLITVVYVWHRFGVNISLDATSIGVIGTLVGAVVGGVFSLLGSIYVNRSQQRATYDIKRKNTIYKPLYDELVNMKENVLTQNPFPSYIEFKVGPQTITPHPQYAAWIRIKGDTRYLETPVILKDQMEKMYAAIDAYMTARGEAGLQMNTVFNEILSKNGTGTNISNIESVIDTAVLKNDKDYNLCQDSEWFIAGKQKLSHDKQMKISSEMYEAAENDKIIVKCRDTYKALLEEQDKAIDILSHLIQLVLYKYEG